MCFMILVTYKLKGISFAGELLATYVKRVYKESKSNEEYEKIESNVLEKKYLVRELMDGGVPKIIEIPQRDVLFTTLNLVAEMINRDTLEFVLSEDENGEPTKILITDFYGFPCISENKEFFIEPIDQEKCSEILVRDLPVC